MTMTRRLPTESTTENLALVYDTVLTFGTKVLVAGYHYSMNGCYYGAVYAFTSDDHTCEGALKLETVSDVNFNDNGSAIAWCIANC